MSYLSATPEMLTAAAGDLGGLASTIGAASAAAAARTTEVLAAGADEISAQVAGLFAVHGQSYQTMSAEATTFHDGFVRALTGSAGTYASAEAANVAAVQSQILG